MYPLFRSLLFRLEPEQAHALTLRLIRLVGEIPPLAVLVRAGFAAPARPVQAFGLTFQNPVGLAAGYDKDALGWRGLAALGFGHIEVGTVTLRPQPGNPQPRLFRLPAERALINRMGFPGRGADFAAAHLQRPRPAGLVLGINLGKNKTTPLEAAAEDYLALLRRFAPLGDYLAINISSPNTEGLRRLQGRAALEDLLKRLVAERQAQAASLSRPVPLLVKLAPDLSDAELADALEVLSGSGVDGIIATNTTIQREGSGIGPAVRLAAETGGLSGAPLRLLSLQMVEKINRQTGGRLPVIGVGGIMDVFDARQMLDAGAALVQVYTGLIYTGPALVRQIVRGLPAR